MGIVTRPLRRDTNGWEPGVQVEAGTEIERGGVTPLILPGPLGPLMRTANGGYIPAAQDPTDKTTWRVPVVFT